jgi:CheY-like chemotaxis protein
MHPHVVAGGEEALRCLDGGDSFDVGLIDMEMPGIDGVGVVKHILEHTTWVSFPLILMNATGLVHDIKTEVRAAWLKKPLKQSTVLERLIKVVQQAEQCASYTGNGITDGEDALAQADHQQTSAADLSIRILLAEDNAVNQKVALHMLKRLGYQADLAANGLEVLDALHIADYHVVLMDVHMPEMDGLEATRQVRKRFPDRRPRIIAMTANAMQGDREACLEAGMDDYISKPVKLGDLKEVISRCAP